MNLPEESIYYVLFFLSPFLALISAIFIGYFVYEILSIFKNTILTRLLKIILVPIAFLIYLGNYINRVFDFDRWFDSFLSGGGWETLSSGDKFLIAGPIIIGILYAALKYVIGWGRKKTVTVVEELEEPAEIAAEMEEEEEVNEEAEEIREEVFEQEKEQKSEQK